MLTKCEWLFLVVFVNVSGGWKVRIFLLEGPYLHRQTRHCGRLRQNQSTRQQNMLLAINWIWANAGAEYAVIGVSRINVQGLRAIA